MALTKFRKVVIGASIVTILVTSFSGCSNTISKENPFNGNKITSSSYITDMKVSKAIDLLFEDDFKKYESMDEKEIKAYLLYDAIINNDNFTSEEKQRLSVLIEDWKSNDYLDYETLYNKLESITIQRDVNFQGTNVIEQYYRNENKILLSYIDENASDYKTKKEKITNKLIHAVRHASRTSEIKPGEEWLEEAYCSILDSEDMNADWDYKLGTNTIRVLCEILGRESGPEIIKKARYEGDIQILTDALKEKGISEELCEKLYNLEEEYKNLTGIITSDEIITKRLNISNKCAKILSEMYKIAHNDPAKETYVIEILLSSIMEDEKLNMNMYKFYYYNETLKEEYPTFAKESDNGITYYDEYTSTSYRISNIGEKIFVSSSEIEDSEVLDQALSYKENNK